jgi:hypothetical protein
MFQPSNSLLLGIRQIYFRTCFNPQRAFFWEYDRYISRHVSALRGQTSWGTTDTIQDMFQTSKGLLLGIRQIYFKTCFNPKRAFFWEYDRYISRKFSVLKGPSSGKMSDTFEDMFHPSKGKLQRVRQI